MINNVKLGIRMPEQFDVKLVEEAKYHTPHPGYRKKLEHVLTWNKHEEG